MTPEEIKAIISHMIAKYESEHNQRVNIIVVSDINLNDFRDAYSAHSHLPFDEAEKQLKQGIVDFYGVRITYVPGSYSLRVGNVQ